jgi:hypothetical protein
MRKLEARGGVSVVLTDIPSFVLLNAAISQIAAFKSIVQPSVAEKL